MAQLATVVRYLDSLLQPALFKADSALNGLQVEARPSEVKKVAVAVDAGLSVIEKAVAQEADLLIVHHGLFWGACVPITGTLSQKLELLLSRRCALYASHLPLDSHPEVGNGFELARLVGLSALEPFCQYKGVTIGARGRMPAPVPLQHFIDRCATLPGAITPLVLPFGAGMITRVGVATGSAAMAVPIAAEEGLDLLISGEPKQEVYHIARELKINALFCGHYATETVGVRALAHRLERDLDLSTVFIDEPTGI